MFDQFTAFNFHFAFYNVDKDLIILFSIPLGLVVGSFLNVIIYRLPRNLSIVTPPSSCTSCKVPIKWHDNIPVLSFLALLGKCRNCKAKISWQYPLVEILTAALFFFVFFTQFSVEAKSIAKSVMMIYLASCMVALTFIDFEFKILPDKITLSGLLLCITACTVFPHLHYGKLANLGNENLSALTTSLFSAFFGAAVVYLVGFFGELIFRKEAMGFGDVKYMAMLGAILGWKLVLVTFFLACLFGACYGILLFLVTKERYLAFGPFISLGALVLLFYDKQVLAMLRLGT